MCSIFKNDSITNQIYCFCTGLCDGGWLWALRWRETLPMGCSASQLIYQAVNAELFNDEDGDLEEQIDMAVDTVNRRLSDFEGQGSGWRLSCIDWVAIHCSKHSPITGSFYIPTPKSIKGRHAITNIRNKDDLCFLYSILAHIHPIERNPNWVSNYEPFFARTQLFRFYILLETATNPKIRGPKSTHFCRTCCTRIKKPTPSCHCVLPSTAIGFIMWTSSCCMMMVWRKKPRKTPRRCHIEWDNRGRNRSCGRAKVSLYFGS